MLRNAKKLEGCHLRARDGEIGSVEDFFFDDRRWTVRYLVAETGSWLNSRKVLISPAALGAPLWDQRLLPVNLTREQVRDGPPIDTTQPVSREHEGQLTHYYNWPAYWGAMGFESGFAMPMVPLDVAAAQGEAAKWPARRVSPGAAGAPQDDSHLRSLRAVSRYQIEAADGGLGHVEDFLVDDRTWEIFYLVVDTRNWWPGKQVLLAPRWIEEVGWEDAKVSVGLPREAIKNSPAYDPAQPLTPDYAERLHDHYGRPRYEAW